MKKFLAALLALLMLFTSGCSQGSPDYTLGMTFLKIGKADAIVITVLDPVSQTKECVLVDTGEEEDGQEVLEYLSANGIDEITYLIITHFDKDHVGGADQIIENVAVEKILVPDYEGSLVDYSEFVDAADASGVERTIVKEKMEWQIGEVSFQITPVDDMEGYLKNTSNKEVDNDLSLITRIEHGKNSFLLAGDIEKKRIREELQKGLEPCTLLKVPHHGVFNSEMETLIQATEPRYAVITCSKKNPASEEVLNLLRQYHVTTYLTQKGNIYCQSNGEKLQIKQE